MITLKKHFFALVLMLFCGIACQAANDLMTQQITIKLDKAGTLPDKIASNKKYLITNLKIIGDINGTDLGMIRDMAGCDCNGDITDGKLSILDLSEAKIVEGGSPYYGSVAFRKYTSDDILGEKAFCYCSSLTSVIIPTSVVEIGSNAFYNCSGLTSLTISSSVTKIETDSFQGCSNLKEVRYYINDDLTSYLQTGHPSLGIYSVEFKYFLNNQEITSWTIPSDITKIGDCVFQGCSNLTSLTIPSSVTEIGKCAFSGCSSLTSLTIPSGVTKLEDHVFQNCSSLTSLTIPSGVTKIGYSAFENCSNLTSLTIPSGVTKIGYSAFENCSSLTSLTIPSGVTKIEKYVFRNCSSLTSMTIPSSVTEIGYYAFNGCSSLASIYAYAEKVPTADSWAFRGCNTKECVLYVPKGTYGDYWAAEGWGDFENIVEFDAAGIKSTTTSSNAKEVSRYSVNGQRLSSPAKGMNVVKYSDGSVKKIVMQ